MGLKGTIDSTVYFGFYSSIRSFIRPDGFPFLSPFAEVIIDSTFTE